VGEDGGLAVELENRPIDQGLAREHRQVVGEVAGGEVVGAVHDEVVVGRDVQGVVGVEAHRVGHHLDVGVAGPQALGGHLDLEAPDIVGFKEDLALEVALVDHIEVDEADAADPGGGQVEGHGCPQATGAHDEHAARFEAALAGFAHLPQQQVAAVAGALLVVEGRQGVHGPIMIGWATKKEGARWTKKRGDSCPSPRVAVYAAPPGGGDGLVGKVNPRTGSRHAARSGSP
jgi:hypothetical protein